MAGPGELRGACLPPGGLRDDAAAQGGEGEAEPHLQAGPGLEAEPHLQAGPGLEAEPHLQAGPECEKEPRLLHSAASEVHLLPQLVALHPLGLGSWQALNQVRRLRPAYTRSYPRPEYPHFCDFRMQLPSVVHHLEGLLLGRQLLLGLRENLDNRCGGQNRRIILVWGENRLVGVSLIM